MSKSKAKKLREHLVRNGSRDVTLSRGISPDISTHVRTTKTKKTKLERLHTKNTKQFELD